MKQQKLNKEEQYFNEKLNQLDYKFDPADWNALEKQLPNGGSSAWTTTSKLLTAAAVTLVLVAGAYYLNSDQTLKPDEVVEKELPNSNLEEKKVTEVEGSIDASEKSKDKKAENVEQNESRLPKKEQENSIPLINEVESDSEIAESNSDSEEKFENSAPTADPIEKAVMQVQENSAYQFEKLIIPSKICPNSAFKAIAEGSSDLPSDWRLDWIIDGNKISSTAGLNELEIQENGSKLIEVKVYDQAGKLKGSGRKAIDLYDLSTYELNFGYEDQTDPYNDLKVTFEAEKGFDNYNWTLENGKLLDGDKPAYIFKEKGVFDVKLSATSPEGCLIEVSKPISVNEDFDPLAPNAFTPDQDGMNDSFIPVGFVNRDDRFKMDIYDLHGELVYRTNDVREGWNGQLNNNGRAMPQDIYVWKVVIANDKGEQKTYAGNLKLLRAE